MRYRELLSPLTNLFVMLSIDIYHEPKHMPDFNIDFEWWRDEAGYDYVPAAPGKPSDSEVSPLYAIISEGLAVTGKPARIVRRGGKLVPIRPFDMVNRSLLYKIFANIGSNENSLLQFVTQYGPLTEVGNGNIGEETIFGIGHAQVMHQILRCAIDERAAYFSRFGQNGVSWSRIDVALFFNPITGKPQFRLKPPTLINALWLDLGHALSSDASIRNCLHCGGWFEAGPGTGRREDAKYCCAAHQIAFNSRKRTKGRGQHA
jgi:hypothetical protein